MESAETLFERELHGKFSALGYETVSIPEEDFSLFLRDEPYCRKLFITGKKADKFGAWRKFLAERVLPCRREEVPFSVAVLLPQDEKISKYLAELSWVESVWIKTEKGVKNLKFHPRWNVEERIITTVLSNPGEEREEVELYDPSRFTHLLLLVNTVMIIYAAILGGSTNEDILIELGAKYSPLIWMGEPWRLVTPLFLHAGFLHFFINSYALFQLGRVVDRLFGMKRYILIYFSSGIVGSAVSTVFRPEAVSVGASGAIFGLLGALIYFSFRKPGTARRLFGSTLWTVLGINLVLGFIIPGIDYFGHLGGAAGGLLAGAAVGLGKKDRLENRWVFSGIYVILMIIIVTWAFKPPADNWYRPLEEGRLALKQGQPETAVFHLEKSYRLNPRNPLTKQYLIRGYRLKIHREYKKGMLIETEADYRRLITLDDDWRYRFNLSYIYYRQKKYREALKELEIVLERQPDNKEARELYRHIKRFGY